MNFGADAIVFVRLKCSKGSKCKSISVGAYWGPSMAGVGGHSYIHVYMYIYIYIYMNTYVYIYIYIYVAVIFMCIYIHIHGQLDKPYRICSTIYGSQALVLL